MHRTLSAMALLAVSTWSLGAGTAADVLKNFSADLAMPDSPGMAIVGLSSENVLHPTTPRALGAALKQGRNADGTIKQGFALDFAPFKLWAPSTTRESYKNSPWLVRPLWNTQLSLGVGQPLSDKDSSTRVGLGVSTLLWRPTGADPLLDSQHIGCLDGVLASIPSGPFPGIGVGPASVDSAVKEGVKACRKQLADRTWNATGLMLGLAVAKVSGRDPAVLPDASPRGYWLSLNYGFEDFGDLQQNLQFTASYRQMRDEIVTDPADKTKFVAQDNRMLGAKLYGRFSVANLYIEASRQRATVLGREAVYNKLFVLGAERKLSDDLWLTLAVGTQRGGTRSNPSYVSTGLKWGFSEDGLIKAP